MRSRINPGLAGRCPRCWIRTTHCICAEVPRVPTRTKFLVVRHPWETRKTTGTARVAELALEQCRCLELGADPTTTNRLLQGLEGAWLLYPDGTFSAEHAPSPEWLVVLDGTWAQTRRMLRRLTSLHGLPCWALPAKSAPVLRLRSPHHPEGRSTLEAIADALALLEGPSVAEPLRSLHQRYVEQVLRARGAWAGKRPTRDR
jgi:DTW domain-containing protein YfiP